MYIYIYIYVFKRVISLFEFDLKNVFKFEKARFRPMTNSSKIKRPFESKFWMTIFDVFVLDD